MSYFLEKLCAKQYWLYKDIKQNCPHSWFLFLHVSNAQRVRLGLNDVLIDSKYTREPQTVTKLVEKLQIGENHRDIWRSIDWETDYSQEVTKKEAENTELSKERAEQIFNYINMCL